MDREVKVRIDLLLDNQATIFDTLKAIQKEADKSEDKLKRLRNLQGTGNYQFLIQKEIDLVRQRNKEYLALSTANQPFMEAERRLRIEQQIYTIQQKRAIESKNLLSLTNLNRAELEDQVRALQQKRAIESKNLLSLTNLNRAELEDSVLGIQQKRAVRGANRQQEIALLMEQDRDAKDRAALARQAHYQARYGRLGGVMSAADRLTMSGFGYAAASGTMLGMAGAAGGTAVGTFTGALQRATGEIGLMFVPAIMSAANVLHRFGNWVSELNPAIKTTVGYLAMGGLGISAGAKVLSMAGNGLASLSAMTNGFGGLIGMGGAGGGPAAPGSVAAIAAQVIPIVVPMVIAAAGVAILATELKSDFDKGNYGRMTLRASAPTRMFAEAADYGSSRNRDRVPLAIPGFQSQQVGIFELKDMIQRESLRDPSSQATFELSVKEFQKAVQEWNANADRRANDAAADANLSAPARTVRNILVNLGLL